MSELRHTGRRHSAKFLALLAAVTTSIAPAAAQGPHKCSPGTCGSPLAGPCAPARMTYGYVPTSWRRWPTDTPKVKQPEQVPTPATAPEELPDPNSQAPAKGKTPSKLPSTPSQPATPRPAVTAPFGEDSLTPPFGNESSNSPFGDEPQAPPSSADPLSSPFEDDPPAPPADELPMSPSSRDAFSPQLDPIPVPGGPTSTAPTDDSPPVMPNDDPFKDDPEPSSPFRGTQHGRDARDQLAVQQRLSMARAAVTPGRRDTHELEMSRASEPRLLRADGESLQLGPAVSSEVAAPEHDENPLRQVSHPVRHSSYTTADVPATPATTTVWRQNPLRAR